MTKSSRFRPRGGPTDAAPWKQAAPRPRPGTDAPGERPARDGSVWLYGSHAVAAALANPARQILEVRCTRNASESLPKGTAFDLTDTDSLAALLPPGAVHQGVAARVLPLPDPGLDAVLTGGSRLLVVLDQVTDPQNVGAVFRSAAAFEAGAIISQDRNAAPLSGALAKAAAGGVESVADVRVVNIAQAIRAAQEAGWRAVGLAGEAECSLEASLDGSPTLIVLGAEGKGLRHLVAQTCDVLARIPIGTAMESLNVSVAAGVALSAAAGARQKVEAETTARSFLKAMAARDLKAAQDLCASDFKAVFPGGEVFTKTADIPTWTAARAASLTKRVTAARVTPVPAGHEVALTGVLSGEWLDGTAFSAVRFCDLFTVVNGKIVGLQVWNDLAEVFEPAKAATDGPD